MYESTLPEEESPYVQVTLPMSIACIVQVIELPPTLIPICITLQTEEASIVRVITLPEEESSYARVTLPTCIA